jgi:hypothetical protein
MPKLINKGAINQAHATNATGILSLFGGMAAAVGGISHGEPIYMWLPAFAIGFGTSIAQWLQGEPSKETMLIARVLDLQPGMTNADLGRNMIQRFLAERPKSTPAPPPAPPMTQRSRPAPEPSLPVWSVPPSSPPPGYSAPVSLADFPAWQAEALADDEFAEISQIF